MRVKKYTFLFTLADGTTHSIPIEIPTGDDGGYYLPKITQVSDREIEINFIPSEPGMPAVDSVTVELPAGQGSGGNAVLYTEQNLTDEQKEQARENIGAATVDEVLGQIPSVGGSNCIELIESFTLTEDTSSFVRDKFPDGTPYKLKTVFVVISALYKTDNKWFRIMGLYDKDLYGGLEAGINKRIDGFRYVSMKPTITDPGYGVHVTCGIQEVNGVITTLISDATTNPGRHDYPATTGSRMRFNTNSANLIEFELAAEVPMISGTTIHIYGVRA